MGILLTLLATYLLLALFVALTQRSLIYYPTRLSPELALRLAEEEGFQPWRTSAGRTIGWFLPATNAPDASVLIVHGNAGSAVHRRYLAQPVHQAAPADVFVLEYPGYGARDGSPSMDSFLAAGEAAFDALPADRPVYIVAESLGCGVAAHLARKHGSRVAGLLFFAPFDDLAAVGQKQMPFLPVSLLLRDRFKPTEWLRDYRGPLVVVVAEADTIIPPQFGRRLYEKYTGPKKLQVIRGAGHNDIAAQPPQWWREVFSFWHTPSARRESQP